jgi:Mg2+/Co2+ transporter CorC
LGRQDERRRAAGILKLSETGVRPALIQELLLKGISVESAALSVLDEIAQTGHSLLSRFTGAEDKVKGLSSGATTMTEDDELDADLRLAASHGIKTR